MQEIQLSTSPPAVRRDLLAPKPAGTRSPGDVARRGGSEGLDIRKVSNDIDEAGVRKGGGMLGEKVRQYQAKHEYPVGFPVPQFRLSLKQVTGIAIAFGAAWILGQPNP